jgi:trimeric autotransporter adhesin
MGAGASAGNGGVAFGDGTTATGLNSAAVGVNANATFANSAAFGTGATVTRVNQQVFGTALSTYTAPGITSGASLATQSGPLQIVTSDAGGNLATNTAAGLGLATTSQIATINNQLASLGDQIGDLRRGIAATNAIAYVATPSGPGRTTLAVNGSSYDGVGGFGIAFAHRFAGTTIPFYVSGAYGNGGGREQVGRVGFAVEW